MKIHSNFDFHWSFAHLWTYSGRRCFIKSINDDSKNFTLKKSLVFAYADLKKNIYAMNCILNLT